jgi:hypothetical protein
MQAFMETTLQLLKFLSANARSTPEMIIAFALACIACVITIQKTGQTLKFAMPETGRTLAVIALGSIVLLASVVSMKLYLVPHLQSNVLKIVIPSIIAFSAFLAIVVPFACFMLKSRYFQTIFSILLGIVMAAILIFLTRGVCDAARKMAENFSKTKGRTESTNIMLEKK